MCEMNDIHWFHLKIRKNPTRWPFKTWAAYIPIRSNNNEKSIHFENEQPTYLCAILDTVNISKLYSNGINQAFSRKQCTQHNVYLYWIEMNTKIKKLYEEAKEVQDDSQYNTISSFDFDIFLLCLRREVTWDKTHCSTYKFTTLYTLGLIFICSGWKFILKFNKLSNLRLFFCL